MKINMKRRLQIQFVFLSVAALVLLQAVIVGLSISRSYRQMTTNANRIILLANTSPDSSELGDARYFRVSYDIEDKTFETDLAHTSLVTQAIAMEYARDVIDMQSDSGYVQHYRYLVHRGKDGIHITFLSRYEAIEAFRNNTETLILDFPFGGNCGDGRGSCHSVCESGFPPCEKPSKAEGIHYLCQS